jgi:hypothetical protein
LPDKSKEIKKKHCSNAVLFHLRIHVKIFFLEYSLQNGKEKMCSSIEALTEVKDSKFGKGLFAKKPIPANTILCIIFGDELNFNETIQLKEESHAFQIDFDRYLLCKPPFLYTNHSCDPNCGINSRLELFSLKNIREGEELFWDYSTSMLERHWTMQCSCGAKDCRKLVTDFDLLPEKTQSRYLHLNIVLPFIVNFLRQGFAKTA